MKRRIFITGVLAAISAIAALADPTQARPRRRGRRASRGGRRGRVSYQPTSYQETRNSGVSVLSSQPRRSRNLAHQNRIASRPTPPAPTNPYERTRGSGGRLTEDNVLAFRQSFDQKQSREAMRSALGEPAEQTLTQDRWRITRTDIYGKPAPDSWFEADYGIKGAWDSKAQTIKPPIARW